MSQEVIKPELKDASPEHSTFIPANQNPWYVLMTLYGEQDGKEIDWELHERNCEAWNVMMGPAPGHSASDKIAGVASFRMPANPSGRRDQIGGDLQRVWHERNGEAAPERWPSSDRDVSLRGVEVDGHLVMAGFFFGKELDLSKARVAGELNMERTYVAKFFSFYDAKVNKAFHLEGAHVGAGANGSHLNALGGLIASQTCFGSLNLEDAKLGQLSLMAAELDGDLRLDGIQVACDLDADYLTVGGKSEVRAAVFSGATNWDHAHFNKAADFRSADFVKAASFQNAIFEGAVEFTGASFSRDVSFKGAHFAQRTSFAEASFGRAAIDKPSIADLRDVRFDAPTSFARAEFANQWPLLSGTILNEVTLFTAANKYWPMSFPRDPEEIRPNIASIRHAVAKQGLPEEEHFFYRKEMQCAARTRGARRRVLFMLFELLSFYGHSVIRPSVALLTVWAFGFVMLWGYFAAQSLETPLYTAAGLSFSNLFPAFGFTRLYFDGEFIRDLPIPLKAWAGFQTVVSLPLLFFLGLGLRNRFRLR